MQAIEPGAVTVTETAKPKLTSAKQRAADNSADVDIPTTA
ncbi:hypothetical protein PR003_g5317 [Phytophthora rubi]|uniref:Uncharacterized protein n=1 Tax=Phytophthora rubi TaxID=129364 RepID=A0A6A4FTX8_9STRA|nr:hypothetical protein PR003_g5317 [Phytophthora rubi]